MSSTGNAQNERLYYDKQVKHTFIYERCTIWKGKNVIIPKYTMRNRKNNEHK